MEILKQWRDRKILNGLAEHIYQGYLLLVSVEYYFSSDSSGNLLLTLLHKDLYRLRITKIHAYIEHPMGNGVWDTYRGVYFKFKITKLKKGSTTFIGNKDKILGLFLEELNQKVDEVLVGEINK